MGDRWNSENLETEGVIHHEEYVEVENAHPVIGFLRLNAPFIVGKTAHLPEKEYHRISSVLLTKCCNTIRFSMSIK
jgi:hypothetical protein